ncbi:MAG: hypothetical protein LBM38_05970 [Clostridiales bacterium]|jgi:hypothetical protein|nr:hypothetical protein [Clostridiales bacterium]
MQLKINGADGDSYSVVQALDAIADKVHKINKNAKIKKGVLAGVSALTFSGIPATFILMFTPLLGQPIHYLFPLLGVGVCPVSSTFLLLQDSPTSAAKELDEYVQGVVKNFKEHLPNDLNKAKERAQEILSQIIKRSGYKLLLYDSFLADPKVKGKDYLLSEEFFDEAAELIDDASMVGNNFQVKKTNPIAVKIGEIKREKEAVYLRRYINDVQRDVQQNTKQNAQANPEINAKAKLWQGNKK